MPNFELHISFRKGPEEAGKFFSVTPDTYMLCLESLRGKPGLPFVYFISYFNPQIPMTVEEDMTSPLYEILEKKYRIFVKTSKEMVFAREADAEMAAKLSVSCSTGTTCRLNTISAITGLTASPTL